MAKLSIKGIVYTSAFGPRKAHRLDPNPFHYGADYGPPVRGQTGVPLFAIIGGVVTRMRDQHGALGIRIGSRATEALEYWHLANYADTLGKTVREGELVGEMGTTGISTGIHVHVEHWVKGKRIDPVPLINRQASKAVAKSDGDTDNLEDDMALTDEQSEALTWLGDPERRERLDLMLSQTAQLWERRGVIDGTGRTAQRLEWLAGRQEQTDLDSFRITDLHARIGTIDRIGLLLGRDAEMSDAEARELAELIAARVSETSGQALVQALAAQLSLPRSE